MIESLVFGVVGAHIIYNAYKTWQERSDINKSVLSTLIVSTLEELQSFGEARHEFGENGQHNFYVNTKTKKVNPKKAEKIKEIIGQFSDDLNGFHKMIAQTSFLKHYAARLFFRSPIGLYDQNIQEFVRNFETNTGIKIV